jgi:transposase
MLHAGLDLSRRRLDFHLLDERGETVEVGAAPPDADGLRGLAVRVGGRGESVRAAIESMNGARSCTTSSSGRAGKWRSPTR